MRLARITGTATATAKDPRLVGGTLLVADIIDGDGTVLDPAFVALDTVGAGVGDTVLLTFGSAARLPQTATAVPVDAAVIAVIDRVDLAKVS